MLKSVFALALALALALLLVAAPAVGEAPVQNVARYESGNDLHSNCSTSRDFCVGYVMGVADAILWLRPDTVCDLDGTTGGQITDVVQRYLKDNPDRRHLAAASLVWMALVAAFTC